MARPVFKCPIPFDPIYCLGRVFSQWKGLFLVAGGLSLLMMGGLFFVFKGAYQLPFQLLKKPVPAYVAAGIEGVPYKPRDLGDATLLAILTSPEVLHRVGRGMNPALSANQVLSRLRYERLSDTDFVQAWAKSSVSAADCYALSKAWSIEAVQFSQEMQRKDALNFVQSLTDQLAELSKQREEIVRTLSLFAEKGSYYGSNSQLEGLIQSVMGLEVQLSEAEMSLRSCNEKIARYEAAIREQSGLTDAFKLARDELGVLRGRYTNNNPLVLAKARQLAFLDTKSKEGLGVMTTADLADTPLGQGLYLTLVALQAERVQHLSVIEETRTLLAERLAQLRDLPKQASAYEALLARQTTLDVAMRILNARLTEAQLFAAEAPGYWALFDAPREGEVSRISHFGRIIVGAVAIGFFALICGVLMLFVRAIVEPIAQTVFDVAKIFGTFPLLRLAQGDEWAEALRGFWLKYWAIPELGVRKPLVSVHVEAACETLFWEALGQAALQDGEALAIIDLSGGLRLKANTCTVLTLDEVMIEGQDIHTLHQGQWYRVIYRLKPNTPVKGLKAALKADAYYPLVATGTVSKIELEDEAVALRSILGMPAGILTVETFDGGPVAEHLEGLRGYWMNLFSGEKGRVDD